MAPQFENGCFVIAGRNIFHLYKPVIGDVIIFTNPLTGKRNIKRCSAVDDTSVFVTGFNMPESTDSRHFGRISISDIEGWVWKKI